jgi:hypothetical protein
MTNATITFKGASRATLSKIARDALQAAGFVCSDMFYNDAHQNESFVVQNPRKTEKGLGR